MPAINPNLSSDPPASRPAQVIAEQWPTIAQAMGRYEQNRAEAFSRMAYEMVEAGLIRLDDRQRLARAAEEMGIRDFDAQLLIACAVRRWALDRRYDARPSISAPKLSFEYRSWHRMWVRTVLMLGTAIAIDGIILWKWLA
jgi:hypothetical protein